ncbi:bifunctional 5,10-methylenetetrahydrofolate dehydrogenase/5,10-methenyltetrahydrofolate cyclohydrolase [Candidatus Nanosalina sp. VS9-1]|uniref:bifunctional 5,10-methylenetetrahydrofolate dehydrogenase/5,10-methenyltetrahydrofolate cyclohydrolase n=1 Tax=Candidatus Nanosalina sp. VS9-1 TaxID=3388566 RepID=UPI0039DF434E
MIDGEKIADNILEQLEKTDESPHLKIVLVGDNEASKTFVEEKMEAAERIDFKASLEKFDEKISEEKILEKIQELNSDEEVDGVLVQLPLPDHIDEDRVFETLEPRKDVDGLTPENIGKTLRGNPFTVPGAVEAVEKILEDRVNFEGLEVTVINNSNLIGRPLSMRLTDRGATVTLCNEHTEELEKYTRDADVVVTATGMRGLLKPEMVMEDSIVIDAGYSLGKGDVEDKKGMDEKTVFCGVPGGVGPVTVAVTMKNLLKCYRE